MPAVSLTNLSNSQSQTASISSPSAAAVTSWIMARVQLPRWIVKVIDPVTGYMQDRSPRPRGPMFRGGAVYGPGVPGGARQATDEELEEMRAESEAAHRRAAARQWPPVDPTVTATAGQQLIDQGSASIRRGGRELSAQIRTFWHGDSLLDISVHGPERDSSSRSRIPRHLTDQHLSMLAAYLAHALRGD